MNRIFASFLYLLFTGFTLQAQTKWFVMPGALTTGTGTTWADPIDLQTGINAAIAGDSVFAAQGTYQLASGQSFAMKDGVKIYGGFAGTELSLEERNLSAGHVSTLRGDNARVVYNNINGLTAAALLDGFTITNGFGAYGAGMWNRTTSPTISNCTFANNNGGGMYNSSSAATVIKCAFTGNTGTLQSYGGGIGNAGSTGVSIINCIFSGNIGHQGGGVYIDDLGPTSARIINCTFTGNTASSPNGAGGIYCGSRSAPKIQNCIIWGNNGVPFKLAVSVNIPIITNNIMQGGYAGNFNLDPLFVNSANPAGADNIFGTADDGLLLQAGSPAFNTGTPDITGLQLPATDMAGAARIQGGKVDMGVYESNFSCSPFTTLYVDSSVAASGDGSSWATAFKSFAEGLMAANQCPDVTTLLVAKGTYQPTFGNTFSMLENVSIYGGFPAGGGSFAQRDTALNKTILKGNGNRVIYNERINVTAYLDGFTISNGAAPSGGGMYNYFASPSINNCIFSGNAAATNGGAGGAMDNRDAAPVISNCIFSGNTASTTGLGGGGAIWNSASSPIINKCIFLNNTAAYGGAMYNYTTSSPIITNTLFAGNIASGDGAGIANYGTALKLANITFVNNSAAGGGGAIDNYSSNLTVTSTLFWGNTAVNGHTDIWFETGTLNITYSFTQVSRAGTGNIVGASSPFNNLTYLAGVDGLLGNNDDGLTLRSGSPCIDAGIPDTTGLSLGEIDIAGNPRINFAAIDMGAYEFNNSILPITLISFTGSLRNGIANLQWQSGEESNFNHFEVEKSTDGTGYWPLGKLSAKGSGSSYTYSTPQQEPVAYYRLKLVNNDGSARQSRIVRLSQRAGNDLMVYPNPTANYLYIKGAAAGSIHIYAADGRMVKTQIIQAGGDRVEVSELSAGVYYGVINGVQVKFIKK